MRYTLDQSVRSMGKGDRNESLGMITTILLREGRNWMSEECLVVACEARRIDLLSRLEKCVISWTHSLSRSGKDANQTTSAQSKPV